MRRQSQCQEGEGSASVYQGTSLFSRSQFLAEPSAYLSNGCPESLSSWGDLR